MTATTNSINDAISDFVAFINEANAVFMTARFPNLTPDPFYADGSGRKYLRIVQDRGHQRMVHCFVDLATGDVYMPAGWKAPALNGARFNLLDHDSVTQLHECCDPYGGYLYKR